MTNGMYISAMNQGSGKSLIAIGLLDSLVKETDRVGFFRPVFHGGIESQDPLIHLLRTKYNLNDTQARGGISLERCRELLASGDHEEMSSVAVSVYSDMAKHCDVIIVDGTDLLSHNAATVEFDLNAQFAKDLGTPVIAVVGAQESTVSDVVNAVDVARTELHSAKVDVLAVMVNRARPELREEILKNVKRGPSNRPVYVLPELPEIALPTVAEVVNHLGLSSDGMNQDFLDRDIHDIKIAAMTVSNFLSQFTDGDFVIVPGDRSDIMVATLASALAPTFPAPSGMLLTGGLASELKGDTAIGQLVEKAPFPVFSTQLDTFKAGRAVSMVRGQLALGQPRKIAAALGEWFRNVDEKELFERLELERPATMTPLRFLHNLIEKARSDRRSIVLPEGYDPRILRAASLIVRRDFCDLTLIGNPEKIAEICQRESIDLPIAEDGKRGVTIIDLDNNEYTDDFAATYAKLRAHKGMTLEGAQNRMMDPSYFGTMLVHKGIVDGMVSGAVNTTANTIRPSLEFIKTREGVKVVSSVFLMLMEDRVLVFGDCAVNPNPNSEQLADIAKASAETARQFGVDPKVAMLSYSTGTSGSGADVDIVIEATEKLRESNPDFAFEGPIQFDAASNMSIASSKLPGSEVAGQATVFIFPDLNTGNNTYKAVQQTSGAVAVGPVLQGLRKPINDLSRGATVDDIINTVAITAIQAQTL
ncbi:phosphate acetyltransferase [Rothia nasimurium]|uniref:Phosphate acetyltransferase n=1 Tax=Rothia nasimurium TaxID=85336 RepID=A0A4Y9F314_9MICC|nr:phosphate acetyltransferase [Rothia nasimurium]MBF0808720.1 phosphate acetyltransferase [Rothia nasimurium]TFU21530.1 phosphate acetyltransferase [Rothia nasimurium]